MHIIMRSVSGVVLLLLVRAALGYTAHASQAVRNSAISVDAAAREGTSSNSGAAIPSERELVTWLHGQGAEIRVAIGRSATGVRGLYTTAPVATGEVLARVPLSAALTLGSTEETSPELAVQLLRERYRSRPRFAPYFAVLPPPPPEGHAQEAGAAGPDALTDVDGAAVGSVDGKLVPAADATARLMDSVTASDQPPTGGWQPSCVEELPAEALAALAGRDLRDLAARKVEWMRQVWSGEGEAAAAVRLPLARAVPRRNISLAEFAWATCMVTSRSISGPGNTMLLIPLIDLANHCASSGRGGSDGASGPSGHRGAAGGGRVPDQLRFRRVEGGGGGSGGGGGGGRSEVVLELVAGQDLAADEEVCISYGDLRPDEAFLYYGFLLPEQPAKSKAASQTPVSTPGQGQQLHQRQPPGSCAAAAALEQGEARQLQQQGEQLEPRKERHEAEACQSSEGGAAAAPGNNGDGGDSKTCDFMVAAGACTIRVDGGAEGSVVSLFAVDERQYDSGARPGKMSYSRLEAGAGDAEVAAAVAAEVGRLEARLAEVTADAAAALVGPAAGCGVLLGCEVLKETRGATGAATSGGCSEGNGAAADAAAPLCVMRDRNAEPKQGELPDTAVCSVAALNAYRIHALQAELARLRAMAVAVEPAQWLLAN